MCKKKKGRWANKLKTCGQKDFKKTGMKCQEESNGKEWKRGNKTRNISVMHKKERTWKKRNESQMVAIKETEY